MNIFDISLVTNLLATFAVVCIFIYLYIQYHEKYIGFWMLSYLLHLSRLAFLTRPLSDLDILPSVLYQISMGMSGFLLIYGTSLFVKKQLEERWAYFSLFCLTLAVFASITNSNFLLKAVPVVLILGLTYIGTGIHFIRYLQIPGWGRNLTGIAYIILGFHILDLPFFISDPKIAPWGFLLDAILRFMVAFGTILVYFEKTRRDLARKENNYRLLAENALDVIYRYRLNPAGFDFISPSAATLTGYSLEELYAGSTNLIYTLIHPNDRPLINNLLCQPHNICQPLTLRLVQRNHTVVWIEQKGIPLLNNAGTLIGFEGIIRDISVRKEMEQTVSRLDRLNAVGQMAANVAHEIRNPLTTIRGYLQYFSSKEEFSLYISQIKILLDELDRTNQIIKEYLSLCQNKTVDLQRSQLNDIIEALYPLIVANANATSKDIQLSLSEIPPIYLDANEIRQLILNLVRNGMEAMEAGGKLLIKTDCDYKNKTVILSVIDTGSGIPPSALEKLGQPFFTTKDTGTGLGLAVCYRIVNRHQAAITVNTSSAGSEFSIHFNLAD